MERQHQYKPGVNAQVGNLREGHVNAPPMVEGAGAGLLKAATALGGEVINVIAKDYAREMRGRIDDSILRTNAEFEKWKTEYKRTRQGVDALTAQKDFADKYMELANQAVADFGGNGNEIYIGDLKREYAKYGLYAVKEGGAYQLAQDEAWQKSQWEAQLSSFRKIVDDNPYDQDMLNMEAHTLLQSWMAKNPGKDPGAIRDEIQSMLANGRMNALLARAESGDAAALNAAQELLGGGGFTGVGGNEPNHSGPRGHTIAEDFNNPLNLKKVGGGKGRAAFRQFASDADGFRAAWRQLKIYQNGKREHKTPEEMISTWAPPSENNLKKYFTTIRAHGIDPEKNININDPAQAARLIKAMATHEGPLGRRYSFEQIEGFLRGQGGGAARNNGQAQAQIGAVGVGQVPMANTGGIRFSPVQAMRYQNQIDAARKRDMEEAQKMDLNEFLTGTSEYSTIERMKLAEERYGKDPAMREQFRAAIGGIQADERMREYVRKEWEKQQEQGIYNQLQAFSELPDKARGWQEARALIEQLPLDKHGKFYTAFGNLRKQVSVNDPEAVEEVTERLANGEEFNIRAEYGGRLSNRMIEKFNKDAFKKTLPEIKNAFTNAALEWLGDAKNKNHAKEFGFTTTGGLWTRFLDGTDADEKMDATRLRREADDFFKQVLLERGFLQRDVETIVGLQGLALGKYDNARPPEGSEGWRAAIDYLKYRFPDRKKFTDSEITDAYRALTGNPRKENM